jgi:hypothetical protein
MNKTEERLNRRRVGEEIDFVNGRAMHILGDYYTIVANGWQAPYPIDGVSQFDVGLESRLPEDTPTLKARIPIARNSNDDKKVIVEQESTINGLTILTREEQFNEHTDRNY